VIPRRAAAALALAGLLAGCAQTFDAATLGVPVTMASAAGSAPAGDRFRITSHAVFGLWGIVKIKEPSLQKALASQLGGGSGLANVKIRVRSRWNDVLFTVLTAGLVAPRTVTFEGVVTK
jgi:hypothetical protein